MRCGDGEKLMIQLFTKKKPIQLRIEYNPDTQLPVLRCSICTGEQVAGFKDKATGHFTDVMLIKEPQDLERFRSIYNIDTITKEY